MNCTSVIHQLTSVKNRVVRYLVVRLPTEYLPKLEEQPTVVKLIQRGTQAQDCQKRQVTEQKVRFNAAKGSSKSKVQNKRLATELT